MGSVRVYVSGIVENFRIRTDHLVHQFLLVYYLIVIKAATCFDVHQHHLHRAPFKLFRLTNQITASTLLGAGSNLIKT